MESNEFMLNLQNQLRTEKKVAESTANAYVRVLFTLNEKRPYKNFSFLKDVPAITGRMAKYADTTKDSVLGAICSVLSMVQHKPTMKKLYNQYHEMYAEKSKEVKEVRETNEKTEKQKKNWISWEDVIKRRKELEEDVGKFKRDLSDHDYDKLQQYLVLSLYTEVQPRRNQDYLDMYVVKKYNPKIHITDNYYDLATKTMIFTKYKTAKKYGTQTQEVPEALQKVIEKYLKYHAKRAELKNNAGHIRLLVNKAGEPMEAMNVITRLLNKAFGKNVGSSMLRHIYLSDKYSDTLGEMKDDAKGMGHSLTLQKEYIKMEPKKSEGPTLVIHEGPGEDITDVVLVVEPEKKKRIRVRKPKVIQTSSSSLPASSEPSQTLATASAPA